MKKLLSLFIALITMASCGQTRNKTDIVAAGDKCPEFTVTMFDGSEVSSDDLRGKVVLMTFWATWCPPCQKEMEQVEEKVIKRFESKDFVYLPVSVGEDKENVERFREAKGYSFPMGLDPEKTTYSMFATKGVPRNYLINRNGKVVKTGIGFIPDKFEEILNEIDKLLKSEK